MSHTIEEVYRTATARRPLHCFSSSHASYLNNIYFSSELFWTKWEDMLSEMTWNDLEAENRSHALANAECVVLACSFGKANASHSQLPYSRTMMNQRSSKHLHDRWFLELVLFPAHFSKHPVLQCQGTVQQSLWYWLTDLRVLVPASSCLSLCLWCLLVPVFATERTKPRICSSSSQLQLQIKMRFSLVSFDVPASLQPFDTSLCVSYQEIYMFMFVYVFMYLFMCAYVHIHIHINININIYILYICVCIIIYHVTNLEAVSICHILVYIALSSTDLEKPSVSRSCSRLRQRACSMAQRCSAPCVPSKRRSSRRRSCRSWASPTQERSWAGKPGKSMGNSMQKYAKDGKTHEKSHGNVWPGGFNPFEKYERQLGVFFGHIWKNKKGSKPPRQWGMWMSMINGYEWRLIHGNLMKRIWHLSVN